MIALDPSTILVSKIVIFLTVVVLLACVPGWIAEARKHRNVSAIKTCGLCGLILPPLWLVALIWSFTNGRKHASDST